MKVFCWDTEVLNFQHQDKKGSVFLLHLVKERITVTKEENLVAQNSGTLILNVIELQSGKGSNAS